MCCVVNGLSDIFEFFHQPISLNIETIVDQYNLIVHNKLAEPIVELKPYL